MRNLRRTLLRLMRLFRRKNLVSPLSSHGRFFQYRIVVLLQLLAPNDTRLIPRWLSLTLPHSLPAKRTSPPSLVVCEDVHTDIWHTNKKKLPHRLYHVGGKKIPFLLIYGTGVNDESFYNFPLCLSWTFYYTLKGQPLKGVDLYSPLQSFPGV